MSSQLLTPQEQGFEGVGTGRWIGTGGSTVGPSVDTSHSGSQSLKVAATASNGAQITVPCDLAATSLTVRLWFKATVTHTISVNTGTETVTVLASGIWQEVAFSVGLPIAGNLLILSVYDTIAGTFYVDDCSVLETLPTPPGPSPGAAPGPFFAVAQGLQSALEATFTTAGLLPARHYVSNGSVAMDLDERPNELDEMLVTEVENIRTGFAGSPVVAPIDPATVFVLDLAVYAIREAPTLDSKGRAPLISSVVASAQEVLYDQWMVAQTILAGIQGRTLFPPSTVVHWGEARPYGPKGGVVGTVTRISVGMT